MGFWSALGKGLLAGAGAIAAPLTGGASLAAVIPAITSGAGAEIGAMGDQAGANRQESDMVSRQFTQDQMNREQNVADLDLRRRGDDRTAMNDAYLNALRSAIASNMQDVSFDRSGFKSDVADVRFSGGTRPSALGPQGRQAAEAMNARALRQLMEGPAEHTAITTPTMQEPKEAGFWEKLAGPLSMGLSMYGGLAEKAKKPQQTPAPPQAPVFSPGVGSGVRF
jgi:hypothetical protein